jgi:ABC-2 type transport system permease protein
VVALRQSAYPHPSSRVLSSPFMARDDLRAASRLFLEVARRAFSRAVAYRGAALAGLVTNLFFGLLRLSVLLALFGSRESVQGFSVADAITFTGLAQALLMVLSIFGWYDLMNTVQRGEVSSDLLRPMDYFSFWLAQDAGRAVAQLLMRGLPILVLYAALFHLELPQGWAQWLAVVSSLSLAWLTGFAFRFLVNLTAFWSPDARGIGRFAFTLMMFATGFLMPLRFFPEWLQIALSWTPFPSMLNTVVEIWLGVIPGEQVARALLTQLAWGTALTALSYCLLSRATKRLVILGG